MCLCQCCAGSFTRPAERASWTRLSPSISCWDGWAETSSTSSVPSWLISCPCRYRGWLSNARAPGRREGLAAALSSTGSLRPKLPGMLPFPPRVCSIHSQGCSLLPLWGCSLPPPWRCSLFLLLVFSLLSRDASPPNYSSPALGGCSLLHPSTLPSPPGTRREQGAPCGTIPVPAGVPSTSPPHRCTRPFTTCWQTSGCSPSTATTG